MRWRGPVQSSDWPSRGSRLAANDWPRALRLVIATAYGVLLKSLSLVIPYLLLSGTRIINYGDDSCRERRLQDSIILNRQVID